MTNLEFPSMVTMRASHKEKKTKLNQTMKNVFFPIPVMSLRDSKQSDLKKNNWLIDSSNHHKRFHILTEQHIAIQRIVWRRQQLSPNLTQKQKNQSNKQKTYSFFFVQIQCVGWRRRCDVERARCWRETFLSSQTTMHPWLKIN